MKKRQFYRLFVAATLFSVVSLITFGFSTHLLAAGIDREDDRKEGNDGTTRFSREAQLALVEASRRFETNPDDLAAARQPMIEYMAAPPDVGPDEPNPIPLVMYQMLGQYWYADQNAKDNIEEARKVFKAGHEAYPKDEMLLLNYAVTTHDLERFGDAAPLFEKYYDTSSKHEVKFLSYAASDFYNSENLKEAKRVFIRMIDAVEIPESSWLEMIIQICQQQEDEKEADKYIRLALSYYPMETRYWNQLAYSFLNKEDYKGAASAFEIATRVKTPDKESQWKQLVDIYNYIGLPLRSAARLQEGFKLMAEKNGEDEQHILVAEAYARGARVDKAISYLDGVLSKRKTFDLLLKKGKILYDARRNKEAIAVFDECAKMNPKAYSAQFMKALAAWDLEDWDTAKEAFDMAVNSDDYRFESQQGLDMIADLDKAKAQ